MQTISGTLQSEIAKEHGITKQMVHYLAKRDQWRIVAIIGRVKVYESSDVKRTMSQREKKHGTHSTKR